MQIVLRAAEREFCHVLREAGNAPPALREVTVGRYQYRFEIVFTAHFSSPPERSWSIAEEAIGCYTRFQLESVCRRDLPVLYSRMFEDHLLELELAPARARLREVIEQGANADAIYRASREFANFEEHVSRHHRRYPPIFIDYGREPMGGGLTVGSVIGTTESQLKGEKLLTAWLSPEQAKQYEQHKHFDVIGSNTGKRYRIRHGRQMNIDELDEEGRKVCGWCFLPQGQLVAGDVMLAQKIALETDELAALKVANRFEVEGPNRPTAGLFRDLYDFAPGL